MGNEESRMMGAPLEHAKGVLQRVEQYASEVKTETKRVTWPSLQEVYGTTIMVILTTFVFGIYFWICDQAFQSGISQILRRFIHRG